MSRTADIGLVFARAVTVGTVVRALAGERWSLQEPLGISYMVNNDDLFDWQSTSTDQAAEVLTLVDSLANGDHNTSASASITQLRKPVANSFSCWPIALFLHPDDRPAEPLRSTSPHGHGLVSARARAAPACPGAGQLRSERPR